MQILLLRLRVYLSKLEVINVIIDSVVFRVHCNFTRILLMAFSTLVATVQFLGLPIRCILEGVPTHVVNTYCWIMTTFIMPGIKLNEHISNFLQGKELNLVTCCSRCVYAPGFENHCGSPSWCWNWWWRNDKTLRVLPMGNNYYT